MRDIVLRFTNCRLLRHGSILREDLYVLNGIVIDPMQRFYDRAYLKERVVNCNNCIISPGFIDIQVNGGVGIDFSNCDNIEESFIRVARDILSYGTTSFCPTIVSSPSNTYKHLISELSNANWPESCAKMLGLHFEGPFLNPKKCGVHNTSFLKEFTAGFSTVQHVYGDALDLVKIITIAPEIEGALGVIKSLTGNGIIVSIGHSAATFNEASLALENGASMITHFFNCMNQLHHREPGIIGLCACDDVIYENKKLFYGMITDNIHTHSISQRIAFRSHPHGLIISTDANPALGLKSSSEISLQNQPISLCEKAAYQSGTNTLAGSVVPMDECIRTFMKSTSCSVAQALECATLHPAQLLNLDDVIGSLNYGCKADLVLLNEDLHPLATYINGNCVWCQDISLNFN